MGLECPHFRNGAIFAARAVLFDDVDDVGVPGDAPTHQLSRYM